MKCAKEVMEQWKASTDEQYKKNLCEVVGVITEDLFSLASKGYPNPPEKYVDVYPIKEGRFNAVEIAFSSDGHKFRRAVFWHDFVEAMESLCYKVSQGRALEYSITPNPSC